MKTEDNMKQDSMQKTVINHIKRGVKTDLQYAGVKTQDEELKALFKHRNCMMLDPVTKYRHTFEHHVGLWLENGLYYSEFTPWLNNEDIEVIEKSIKKWQEKMKVNCWFI